MRTDCFRPPARTWTAMLKAAAELCRCSADRRRQSRYSLNPYEEPKAVGQWISERLR
jgi:hypothetical protein